jgi:predicted RNA-binding protein associated with RNAse of E/G family
MTDLHPPKTEVFDPASQTNTDPKGIVREVEVFREEPFGLYLARPTPGRAQFRYLESWLLPSLGLRVTDFWFNPGHERDQDFYLDVVGVQRDGGRWMTKDLYLDIVLREKVGLDVIDTDELLDASNAGLLTPGEALSALETTYAAVDGLARHGYDLGAWLATKDIELTWKRH